MTATHRSSEARFLRFTLRQLFVLFTLVGVLLVIFGWRSRSVLEDWRQQRANRWLSAAVRAGDVEAASSAIAAGAHPWTISRVLRTAIESDDLPIARLLLDAGADLEPPFHVYGDPPIRSCIEAGRVEMLELLLRRVSKVGSGELIAALKTDHQTDTRSRMVKVLLSHGADIQAALDYAALGRDVLLANELRQYGAVFTPRVAAELGLLEELSCFVAEDPSIVHKKYAGVQPGGLRGETTLLSIALERADREMARFLLETGASPDVRVYNECTLLHSAALGGDPELVRWLLGRGLDPNVHNGDASPLILAIRLRHTAAAALLIESGAQLNVRSGNGWTPLMEALMRNNVRVVELLLAAGADPSVMDPQGRTAYDWAKDMKRAEILELLERTR